MFVQLSKLTRLTELRVKHVRGDGHLDMSHFSALKSVQILQLTTLNYETTYSDHFYGALAHILPNLRKVTVVSSNSETRANFRMCFNVRSFPKLREVRILCTCETPSPPFFGRHGAFQQYECSLETPLTLFRRRIRARKSQRA